MRIKEITTKPKSAEQLRINALKQQKDNINKQLKSARDRQKINKAQQTIANIKLEQASHL